MQQKQMGTEHLQHLGNSEMEVGISENQGKLITDRNRMRFCLFVIDFIAVVSSVVVIT